LSSISGARVPSGFEGSPALDPGAWFPAMPGADRIESWFDGGEPMARGEAGGTVQLAPVSPKMNSPRHVAPDCIEAPGG
jgi:hypothetical protein